MGNEQANAMALEAAKTDIKAGKYKRAIKDLEQYLSKYHELFGNNKPNCPEVADIYGLIGDIYAKQERYEEALESFCNSYKIFLKIKGVSHVKTQEVYQKLCEVSEEIKRIEKAKKELTRSSTRKYGSLTYISSRPSLINI